MSTIQSGSKIMSDFKNYKQSGVDYSVLDQVKSDAINFAKSTVGALSAFGASEYGASRGASAYVMNMQGLNLAIVTEGLGTKSVIAEQYLQQTGQSRFHDIAVDAVAAIVNDVISVGALPALVTAYFSTGDASWYEDPRRSLELLKGWRHACELSQATWGGGESPALPGLVAKDGLELGGSSIGVIPEGIDPIFGDAIQPGQQIILLKSSGLHTNGASLARLVAKKLPKGLLTTLPSGRDFGSALLDPSIIYVKFVKEVLAAGIRPSFLNAVTGHGLMKVMRGKSQVKFVIEDLPEVPEVLETMVDVLQLSKQEAYSTLNMGIGYILTVDEDCVAQVLHLADLHGYGAIHAGYVAEGKRGVVVPKFNIEYLGEDLKFS
ncbi:phosphoribosylformylglycinamidine cyclo-ligase [Corynebacterium sp. sy039]|nr:phosphoribosylformylglycinamidine cyclo-ligase [Corynebacterium sp. sy039]